MISNVQTSGCSDGERRCSGLADLASAALRQDTEGVCVTDGIPLVRIKLTGFKQWIEECTV